MVEFDAGATAVRLLPCIDHLPSWLVHAVTRASQSKGLASNPLIAAAMPYMVHLSRETGETINLTVPDWPEIVFVSRIVGRYLLSTGVTIGTRLPAHATATGLAMLSAFDAAESGRLLRMLADGTSAQAATFDLAGIQARLKLARLKGYVLSVSEYFPTDISLGGARPIPNRCHARRSFAIGIDRQVQCRGRGNEVSELGSAGRTIDPGLICRALKPPTRVVGASRGLCCKAWLSAREGGGRRSSAGHATSISTAAFVGSRSNRRAIKRRLPHPR